MIGLNLRRGNSTIRFGQPAWTGVPRGRCCALIHGYNVKNAEEAYAWIAERMPPYDTVVGVWWPGSELAFAFWLAERRAYKAGRILAQELDRTGLVWDIEAHSLGCVVALEAALHSRCVRRLLLTAAAVDCDELAGRYKDVGAEVHVFWSKNDPVLKKAYPLGGFARALGCVGPRPGRAGVWSYDLSQWIDGHSKYRDCDRFYDLWKGIVERNDEGKSA